MRKLATVTTVTVLLTVMSAGCATHHAMSERDANLMACMSGVSPSEAAQLERAITDGDIARLLNARVRAKLPTTLAVAKLNFGCSYNYGCGYRCPGLETLGAEELVSWEKVVADETLITGVQPIAALAVNKPKEDATVSLRTLREAAARQNCELLLVYLQDDRYLENLNDAAILYWTVIGLWVVPGTEVECRTVMQAVLVDCRTGSILGTATGEDHPKRTCPAAFTGIKHDKLAARTAEKSLEDLQVSCRKLLRKVVAASRTAGR